MDIQFWFKMIPSFKKMKNGHVPPKFLFAIFSENVK